MEKWDVRMDVEVSLEVGIGAGIWETGDFSALVRYRLFRTIPRLADDPSIDLENRFRPDCR